MQRIPAILFISSLAASSLAGNPGSERIWLNGTLQTCERKAAAYYLEPAGTDAEGFKALIYTKEGKLKAEGHYADVDHRVEHGTFIFYHANGKVESTGRYDMGRKTGVWLRYDEWGRELAEKVYDPEPLKDILYAQAETMPQYPGGQKELVTYLRQRAVDADGINTHGTAIATFVVEPDGELTDVKVSGTGNATIDERMVNALEASPPWIAGQQDGVPVRVKVQVPVPY